MMTKIATDKSDVTILTSDNPKKEDPCMYCNAILHYTTDFPPSKLKYSRFSLCLSMYGWSYIITLFLKFHFLVLLEALTY